MNTTMKALALTADWRPRPDYQATPGEIETRRAVNAGMLWAEPRLELGEHPLPRPADDEVLVKVRACGICGSDTHCFQQDEQGYIRFSGPAKLPVIIGHEFAGEVVATGRQVKTLKTGDAVAAESVLWCGVCPACRSGHFNQCRQIEMLGLSSPGAFAEYVAVREKYCWKLDPLRQVCQSDDEVYELGALIEPIGCAYNGLFVAGGGFKPGAYVAIYGAGPIGLGAVLMARAAGAAKILVFDPSEPRNRLAQALGADYAASPGALARQGSSPSAVVAEMTGGQGADMQVEAAGAASATLPEIVKSFAPNGTLVFLGRHDSTALVEFDTLVSQANRMVGARGHAGYGTYGNIIRLIAAGRIPARQMITSRFPFAQVMEAFVRAGARDEGKIMVRFP